MDIIGDYASGEWASGAESGSGTCASCRTQTISPGGITAIILIALVIFSCGTIGAWYERKERMQTNMAPFVPVRRFEDVEAGPSTDHPPENPVTSIEIAPVETRISIELPEES